MSLVVFDCETTTDERRDLVCAGFFEPATGRRWVLDAVDTVGELEYRIGAGYTFLNHNIAYDWFTVRQAAGWAWHRIYALYNEGRIRDTLVRQQLLDVRDGCASDSDDEDDGAARVVFRKKNGVLVKSGLSQADLELYYFDRDRSAEKKDPSAWRMRFGELRGRIVLQYPQEAVDYVVRDISGAFEIYEAQGGGRLPDEGRQAMSALALYKIERRGMGVNLPRVASLKASATARYESVRQKMGEAGFYRLEGALDPERRKPWLKSKIGTKDKKVIESRLVAAYEKQGLDLPRTPKGGIQQDKTALLNSKDELLMELSGAGPLGSIVNTFVPLLEVGERLHTRYNNILATGRISSSKPNLNNLPRGDPKDPNDLGKRVRPCIEPTPGFDLCSVDYDCAELRSHAQVNLWLFKRAAMAEFFQRNPAGDPHLELAASILGISVAEAQTRYAAGDERVKDARQASKALNFGLPGGMGAERLRLTAKRQYKVVMTPQEAKLRKMQWRRRWPEMGRYFEYITNLSECRSSFEQPAPPGVGPHRIRGRSQRAPEKWFSQSANSHFQGLTADGAKRALWLVTQACDDETSPLYGSAVVGFLYDELLVEIPSARSHEGAKELARLMIQGMQEWVPDVPVTAKPTLMSVWSKEAKPVYRSGRLVPWEPLTSAA